MNSTILIKSKWKSLCLFIFLQSFYTSQCFAEEAPEINFGILSPGKAPRIKIIWQPFSDYMSKRTGGLIKIVVISSFKEMQKAIDEKNIDFFYINSYVFYRLKQKGKVVAVAQMKNTLGKITSQSEFIVRRDSEINTVADLKGKNIAFVNPMGAGGYIAPRAYLYQAGLKNGIDSNEIFTNNLFNSIRGVTLGEYDAATMCGLNYTLIGKEAGNVDLKVIAVSDSYPENIIAARKGVPFKLLALFKDEVINMSSSKDGKKVIEGMKNIKIGSFVKYDESSENLTRNLLKSINY